MLCNQTQPDLLTNNTVMNSLVLFSALILLASLVVAQEAQEPYAPAEYRETPLWRQERQERQSQQVARADNWLTRLLSGNWWTWDREAVKTGIFKNENIMVSVGQGLFNFVFSTLAWFTVSQIYSLTAGVNTPRHMRALSISQAADQVLEAFQKFEERQ